MTFYTRFIFHHAHEHMAGSKIPNYCVLGDTAAVARVMEKMGEGMR